MGKGDGVRGSGFGNLKVDQSLIPNPQSLVSLGDKFALSSGLMEITYDTGAKVILQGPVTYEVESANGGYLSVGKLTARLEKKGRGKAKHGTLNAELSDSSSSFIVHRSSFVFRTPTATVTDLGTEFGVEVGPRGDDVVHVFVGRVIVRYAAKGIDSGREIVLNAGRSVRLDDNGIAATCSTAETPAIATRFIRVLPPRVPDPTLAYWRFEDDVPAASPGTLDVEAQHNVVRDWSGHANHLDYWSSNSAGMGSYAASADVPPKSMFRKGCSGGGRSFDPGALDAEIRRAVLQLPAPQRPLRLPGFFYDRRLLEDRRRPIGGGDNGRGL